MEVPCLVGVAQYIMGVVFMCLVPLMMLPMMHSPHLHQPWQLYRCSPVRCSGCRDNTVILYSPYLGCSDRAVLRRPAHGCPVCFLHMRTLTASDIQRQTH